MIVDVHGADEQSDEPVELAALVGLCRAVLDAEGVRGGAEVSLLFVDEPTIAELHERFLGEEGPTDVLSFPLDDEPPQPGRSPDAGGTGPGEPREPEVPDLLGDVVVCPAVAARNAREAGVELRDELAHLVVHGALHLLGHDHDEPPDALAMQARESELLRTHWSDRWEHR